jgi:hypothetical protein
MDDLVAIAARALAERDARIAALTQAADALLFELSVDPAPDPTGHVAQCADALRALLTAAERAGKPEDTDE